jgi:copper chaperone CopZ
MGLYKKTKFAGPSRRKRRLILMKKQFKLQDLDCANCAAKMEEAIKKIDGVENASVSFLSQKLVIEAQEAQFDAIMKQAVKVCRRIEPDCTILL